LIASSKLFEDVELISVTRATAMACLLSFAEYLPGVLQEKRPRVNT
jgi:hypothetical protein